MYNGECLGVGISGKRDRERKGHLGVKRIEAFYIYIKFMKTA
jgi:hypothetical protein